MPSSFYKKTGGRPPLGLVARREALNAGSWVAAASPLGLCELGPSGPTTSTPRQMAKVLPVLGAQPQKAGQGEGWVAHFRVAGDRWLEHETPGPSARLWFPAEKVTALPGSSSRVPDLQDRFSFHSLT